jgi:DNA repair protein RadC
MSITNWPDQERPREKLIYQGHAALSNAELLAIILRIGVKGKDALALSRYLFKKYGSLYHILGMDYKQFSMEPGLGIAKYAQLQASVELSRRYLEETIKRDKIHNANQLAQYLVSQLKHLEKEIFGVIFLNNQHQIIKFEKIFEGSIRGTRIYPREVLKRTLHHNAAAIILTHNHPSGNTEPSQDDYRTTQKLIQALKYIEVTVLDHIIVAGSHTFSFAEHGWL